MNEKDLRKSRVVTTMINGKMSSMETQYSQESWDKHKSTCFKFVESEKGNYLVEHQERRKQSEYKGYAYRDACLGKGCTFGALCNSYPWD